MTATAAAPDLSIEGAFGGPVCGIDEAGRGPLAGPVVAACVHIPESAKPLPFWREVRDSKALSAKKRAILEAQIRESGFFGIGTASPEEIDGLNIHHATLLAMRRACEAMNDNFRLAPAAVLVDGKFVPPGLPCEAKAVVKGDSLSLSIAAASIVAKTVRDRLMAALHEQFPAYGWARNAGYGTAEHLAALRTHGVTIHHRRSFAPVAKAPIY